MQPETPKVCKETGHLVDPRRRSPSTTCPGRGQPRDTACPGVFPHGRRRRVAWLAAGRLVSFLLVNERKAKEGPGRRLLSRDAIATWRLGRAIGWMPGPRRRLLFCPSLCSAVHCKEFPVHTCVRATRRTSVSQILRAHVVVCYHRKIKNTIHRKNTVQCSVSERDEMNRENCMNNVF